VTAATTAGSGTAPLSVTLSADASDPENRPFVLWEWDFEGDGTFDYSNSQSATVAHTYDRAGTYYPIVRVTTDDNRSSVDAVAIKVINSLSLSRDLDTVDTALSQAVRIQTTLGGTTRVSLVVEDNSFNVVRTLVDWTERLGGTYTDSWDGLKDDATMAVEGDYYAVLLYEEDGTEKRLDLRNSSGGSRYNPSRNNAARTFAPFDNNPMSITYHLPVASEVTAFMGYSMSNTRVVTFLSRKPQAKGAHTILWYGTNNEGVVIYPPPGKYFMFGVWAYHLADNGIYLKSGSYVLNVAATPPLFDPTSPAEDGRRAVSRISFTLTGDAAVELSVTDAQTGTLAASKTYSGLVAGENTIEWDGRNGAGEFLAPGRYRLGLTALDDNGSRSLTQYTLQRIYY
jgi:flagellar hook assembly protein FlgD